MAEAFITRRGGGTVVEIGTFMVEADASRYSLTVDALIGKKHFMIAIQETQDLHFNQNFVSLYYNDGYAYLLYTTDGNNYIRFYEGSNLVNFNESTGGLTFNSKEGLYVYIHISEYRYWIFE